jgi:ArsR family transcriptional regulator, arsenate/arsenite/antimonite-responsive transcriptional repressor
MPDVFKALSDPTRREILQLLKSGEMTAGAIADNFAMSKPSVSHHLSVLKAAGLVFAERRGQEIVYSLDTTVFQDVMTYMLGLFGPTEKETRDDE